MLASSSQGGGGGGGEGGLVSVKDNMHVPKFNGNLQLKLQSLSEFIWVSRGHSCKFFFFFSINMYLTRVHLVSDVTFICRANYFF